MDRLESRKALALFCYLCCQARPVPRRELTEVFWGDKPEARGRANLSRVLHGVNRSAPGVLQADRQSVRLFRDRVWLDVVRWEELVAAGRPQSLAAAVKLWRGPFMTGMEAPHCPEFELWLTGEQERWRQRQAQILEHLVAHHMDRGEYEAGLRYAEQLLVLDPWQEEIRRQIMLMLQAMFANRLARLNPRARRLLEVAAVLGRSFSYGALAHVSGEPPE
ncbi:MAG: hypothetical protein D6790_17980 [Caldilineae bacterium]|nr:MAG: hypothetical protein D6790_17980 [Caldilineae bacterium]